MTQKQRTIGALVLLFVVATASYAFLEWQAARPVPDAVMQTATSTPPTDTDPVPSEPPPPPEPGPSVSNHPFGIATLKLGEIASFPNGLSLHPMIVLEDSRCPQGVQCIQAGTLRLSVRVRSASGVSVHEFTPGRSITTEAEEVVLLAAAPATRAGQPIANAEYRFTFEVKERGTGNTGQCFVGGCSAQLCTDTPDMVSTCEYRAEYACYRTATCERQSSGECGWTDTSALRSCLRNPPELE